MADFVRGTLGPYPAGRPTGPSREDQEEAEFNRVHSEALALLRMYQKAGAIGNQGVLQLASLVSSQALAEAQAALRIVESSGASPALVIMPGVPGKNFCAFVRHVAADRPKVIVVGSPEPSVCTFDEARKMLDASLPDVASKLEVYKNPGGHSGQGIGVLTARLFRMSPALHGGDRSLEIMVGSEELADQTRAELQVSRIPADPDAVTVTVVQQPVDNVPAIQDALRTGDMHALQSVLDPEVFSDSSRIRAFRPLIKLDHKEGLNEDGILSAPQNGSTSRGMRGSTSTAWSSGKLSLLNPADNVPEDDEPQDSILDQDVIGFTLGMGEVDDDTVRNLKQPFDDDQFVGDGAGRSSNGRVTRRRGRG